MKRPNEIKLMKRQNLKKIIERQEVCKKYKQDLISLCTIYLQEF